MLSSATPNPLTSTESVDIIEKILYAHVKPLGFRKHGRTLHRFVDGDISQVINLQNGCPAKGVYDVLWINLGIRVPECAENRYPITEPLKKYYPEYSCNIRTRLGLLEDDSDMDYDLKEDPQKIAADILSRLEKQVLPVFNVLNSRDAILAHRAEYPRFDYFGNRLILLEAAMIYGNRGDLPQATRVFNDYYRNRLAEYRHDFEHGTKTYLRMGEQVTYLNTRTGKSETVTAQKDGYVTLYNARRGHLDYLEELAQKLGIPLEES